MCVYFFSIAAFNMVLSVSAIHSSPTEIPVIWVDKDMVVFMGANGSEMAVGGFEATFLREFTVGGLVLGHPAGCEHASLTSSILIVSLRSQKGASFQPAHPHSPVSRARPLPVKPHLQQQPHLFPLCRPRPPFM